MAVHIVPGKPKLPQNMDHGGQGRIKLQGRKVVPPDQTDPDAVQVLIRAVRADFPELPPLLNDAVHLGIKGFSVIGHAIGDHIMIPAAGPAACFVPGINECNVPEIGIATMENDFLDGG